MTYILFSIACDCVLWYTISVVIAFYFFAVKCQDLILLSGLI